MKRLWAKHRASAKPRWFELTLYKEQLGLSAHLLTVDIAIRQNPRRVLSVHELLGDVTDKLRVVLLGERQRLG